MRILLVVGLAWVAIGCERTSPPRAAPVSASSDRAFFGAHNILAVRDLGETLRWYEDKLGFRGAWRWEDGDDFGGIGRGSAWVMFRADAELAARVRGHWVIFFVQGIDSIYAEHKRAGVKVLEEISDRPWGFREYVVEDLNGYYLRIAEPLPCDDEGAGDLCRFAFTR